MADEDAEAAPLLKAPARIKGEGWHKSLERKPIKMLIFR